jgi:hypothetical protein
MKRTVLKFTTLALSITAFLVISHPRSQARVEEKFIQPARQEKTVEQVQKNIKVLTGMPQSQLIPVMNFIAASLGRRCNFCHMNRSGQWDYAADEKPEKSTAREMMKMVLDLHKQKFPGATEISCFTCHRGQNQPVSLPALPLPVPSPRPGSAGPGAGAPGAGATPSAAGPQASPSPTPAMPSAEEVFNKYIAAIGGQANIDTIKSRQLKGNVVQANGTTIPFEILQAAPDKFHIVATIEQGAIERGFNGTAGWEKTARGVRDLTAVEVTQLQNAIGLFRQLKLKEQYTSARVRGRDKIGDRPVYVIVGTTADNNQERLFFDAETGLLLRRITYLQTMLALIPQQVDFDDYRDVDGVKMAFTVRVAPTEVGNPLSTRTYSEVKLNVPVDESKFNMPAATKPSGG